MSSEDKNSNNLEIETIKTQNSRPNQSRSKSQDGKAEVLAMCNEFDNHHRVDEKETNYRY